MLILSKLLFKEKVRSFIEGTDFRSYVIKIYSTFFQNFSEWVQAWIFRDGGRYNCAIARMLIACALGLTIAHNDRFNIMITDWDSWRSGVEASGWTPKGIIKIWEYFFNDAPSNKVTSIIFKVTCVAIISMFLGFFAYIAQIVATAGSIFIVSLDASYGPYWSHAYNVQLLAALAFMFSRRSADVLSLDAFIRSCFGKNLLKVEGRYWWPVIFAELSVALFMFGAFFQKFRETGVYWALSDNIRNSLGITWFQYRSDPPELALFIASHPVVWQTAGLLQLFAQATTILAAFLVARPVFRLIFGGVFFLVEIFALAHVFRFWHPFWVPLCGLSVDWEHFARQIRERRIRYPSGMSGSWPRRFVGMLFQRRIEATKFAAATVRLRAMLPVLGFGAVFFGYYLANIYWRLGESHLNYPFSSMAFYSETRAVSPYGEHRPWPIWTGRIDTFRENEAQPIQVWSRFSHLEDQLYRVNSIAALQSIDAGYHVLLAKGLNVLPGENGRPFTVERPKVEKVLYRAGFMAVPPYPSPIGLVDYHMPLRAVRDSRGFRAIVTDVDLEADDPHMEILHSGFAKPNFEVRTARLDANGVLLQGTHPVSGLWNGSRFFFTEPITEPNYLLVRVSDPELGIDEVYYGADVF